MGKKKNYEGYKAFDYLDTGRDYKEYKLCAGADRVPPFFVPLLSGEEERYETLIERSTVISVHEHPTLWAEDMSESVEMKINGRDFTGYRDLSTSRLDCVFDHMMDGMAYVTSYSGWKWNDVIHDIGIRLCDLSHQSMVVHGKTIDDIKDSAENGKIALVICLESATPIENELDRIEVLYGLGVRSLGICYSESNMLGGGMSETDKDAGLTDFGYDAVKRMNKVGMLVDVGHTNDKTAIDTIEASDKPIYDSHSGPGAIAQGHVKGDEVLHTLAENDGLLGVGGAGTGLKTEKNPVGSIDSFMECVEYCIDLMGIDHVGCGPDTLYGDHPGLYKYWFSRRLGHYTRTRSRATPFKIPARMENSGYVRGLENPNEFVNIARWMIQNGYSDNEIVKIIGGNILRLLEKVW